jgi:hypothetical protein
MRLLNALLLRVLVPLKLVGSSSNSCPDLEGIANNEFSLFQKAVNFPYDVRRVQSSGDSHAAQRRTVPSVVPKAGNGGALNNCTGGSVDGSGRPHRPAQTSAGASLLSGVTRDSASILVGGPHDVEWESTTYKCHKLRLLGTWIPFILATFVGSCCLCMSVFDACGSLAIPCCVMAMSRSSQKHACRLVAVILASILMVCLSWSLQACAAQRLEFVHIPKNAGTAVENAGWRGGISWSRFRLEFSFTSNIMPDGSSCSAYHVPPAMLRDRYAGAELFCVVRDPFERAVSEYTYLLNSDLQASMFSVSWGDKYAKLYHNGLHDFPGCSAEGLNHFVQRTMHLFKSGHRYIDDCHHVPQVEYIWDSSGRQLCRHVIRSEDLPHAFNALMERNGYAVRLGEQKEYHSSACPNISVATLTPQSKHLLREVYAEDFRLLNFSAV